MLRRLALISGLALLGGLAVRSSDAPAVAPAAVSTPAKNWVLPLFTDKEGYRTMTLKGSEVRPITKDQIDVKDLNITVFSGDAAAHVEDVLLSPLAHFFPDRNFASGESTFRFIRDDVEVSGENWTYDHATKKITIQKHTRIVFQTQLPNFLK